MRANFFNAVCDSTFRGSNKKPFCSSTALELTASPQNLWEGMRWDGMGWDGMGWDGMGFRTDAG